MTVGSSFVLYFFNADIERKYQSQQEVNDEFKRSIEISQRFYKERIRAIKLLEETSITHSFPQNMANLEDKKNYIASMASLYTVFYNHLLQIEYYNETLKGVIGDHGLNQEGVNGTNGEKGEDGTNGTNGTNAPNGEPGDPGINGANGPDGPPGGAPAFVKSNFLYKLAPPSIISLEPSSKWKNLDSNNSVLTFYESRSAFIFLRAHFTIFHNRTGELYIGFSWNGDKMAKNQEGSLFSFNDFHFKGSSSSSSGNSQLVAMPSTLNYIYKYEPDLDYTSTNFTHSIGLCYLTDGNGMFFINDIYLEAVITSYDENSILQS